LEFTYRVGRINDDLGKDEDAIAFYLKPLPLGKRTEYYAARAALQIGMIYERKGNKNCHSILPAMFRYGKSRL
jgi:hypothetical protein